jgi:DNA primase
VLELFLAENANLGVLTLPGEADPCEFLLEHGAEAFQSLVEASDDALTHAMRVATQGVDLQRDAHGASRALDRLVETIAKAPRPAGREHHLRDQAFLSRVAAYFRVPEEHLRERMSRLRGKAAKRTATAPARPAARSPLAGRSAADGAASPAEQAQAPPSMRAADLDPAERELMEILLQHSACMAVLTEELMVDWITSPVCREVVERCLEWHQEGAVVDFARLLLEFDDGEVKNLLVELDESGRRKGAAEFETRLRDVLNAFRRRDEDRSNRSHVASLKTGRLTEEEQLALLRQIEQQAKSRQQAQTRQGSSAPMEG